MTFSNLALASFHACKLNHTGYTMRINGVAVAVAESQDKLDVVCNEWQAVTGNNCGIIELMTPNGRVYAD